MRHANDILLVGCGNMGQALVRGWLAEGRDPERIQVIDPDPVATSAAEELKTNVVASVTAAKTPVDIVVLAVKPQQLDAVLPAYSDLAGTATVFLSIAAGKPIEFYERVLGGEPAIVRGMPNMPAAIRRGMTVLTANSAVSDSQRELCESLMSAVGDVAWLAREELMDAVTAVSGSGPAYVFLLIECLADAAVSVGLDRELARRLAESTVAGAGAYALSSDEDARELRRRVTSAGGTTEAALEILLTDEGLPALLRQAVQAANERGRGLA